MLNRPLAGALALALCAAAASTNALAQTPGLWRYTIVTDLALIPVDMKVNFPTIEFSVCRTAADFATGHAFALQTAEGSAERCPSGGFVRTPPAIGSPPGQGELLTFAYACDGGKTLSGLGQGSVHSTRFTVNLESRYSPPVGGVNVVKQTMSARRVGSCKAQPK
jgi:hypothetical protein